MQYKHRSTSCVQVSTFMSCKKTAVYTTSVNHVKNEVFAPALSLLVEGILMLQGLVTGVVHLPNPEASDECFTPFRRPDTQHWQMLEIDYVTLFNRHL